MNQQIDLIYFWSSLVMVAVPLIIFTALTYVAVKGSRKAQRDH
jgi:heme/copper-type cytochrome/quinol oxidase subunit 2